jgi:hypothetical protein
MYIYSIWTKPNLRLLFLKKFKILNKIHIVKLSFFIQKSAFNRNYLSYFELITPAF